MRRAARVTRAVAVVLLASFAVAIGGCAMRDATPTPTVGSPVTGVVLAVDAEGLTDIRGFTLRTPAGQSLDFTLGALENATEFSPSHLKEHQATSSPIRVWFRVENGARVAYRIEDASPS